MKFIVKLSPEIFIKSHSVRLRFIKILVRNIRNILKRYDKFLVILQYWDHLEIYTENRTHHKMVCDLLTQIPGIHHILEVKENFFTSLQEIFEKTLIEYFDKIKEKTFCVRVKRYGKHKFNSMEVERYIGDGLNRNVESSQVKLKNPDVTVNLEIKENRFFLVKSRYEGIGGFPIGTQEDVLSLISGGFDSSVATYMLIRRGCRVHYCFFNLGGTKHEISVRKISYHLWNRFGSSHNVYFISIDFRLILGEIFEKIDTPQIGVVLKRMMVRAASKVARKYGIQALVTGESLGQVSSQTLSNLRLIDSTSDILILRPLIAYDKERIISIARKIGTENIANSVPEYCSFVSKSPTIKAIKEKIEEEEANFDLSILDKVIKEARSFSIFEIFNKNDLDFLKRISEPETVSTFGKNDIILDIRPSSEQCKNPLKIKGAKIISLPFYKLRTKFASLDQSKTWLLWCTHGVMSQLQALHLHEQGFLNVKVYRP